MTAGPWCFTPPKITPALRQFSSCSWKDPTPSPPPQPLPTPATSIMSSCLPPPASVSLHSRSRCRLGSLNPLVEAACESHSNSSPKPPARASSCSSPTFVDTVHASLRACVLTHGSAVNPNFSLGCTVELLHSHRSILYMDLEPSFRGDRSLPQISVRASLQPQVQSQVAT